MDDDIATTRRKLLMAMVGFGASATLTACSKGGGLHGLLSSGRSPNPGQDGGSLRSWGRYPEKTELIMLADRPPLLETPMRYFLKDLTPNDAYFVRWHYAGLPTRIDLRDFRLNVIGAVTNPLKLSFDDLLTKFEPVSGVVFGQCAGNSRSFFRPQVPGAEWANGAMGNAHYKGVRLKDILNLARVTRGALEASFRGLDEPPLQSSPPFEKPLPLDYALNGDAFIAYEMNGQPLPMLNGFPIRLVVPGWFATYWVKSLSQITVQTEPLKSFWVDTAYRIPSTPTHDEDPKHPSEVTQPLTTFPTRSVFVSPDGSGKVRRGVATTIEGIAVDAGAGIARVEMSVDGGRSWADARLNPVIDKYSWRRWRADWKPAGTGTYKLQCRATNNQGQTQPVSEWNHSGYQRHSVQTIEVEVI